VLAFLIFLQIDEQMKQGHQQFSVPVSYYLNDKERLDHQLSFVKDQSGQYQFEGTKQRCTMKPSRMKKGNNTSVCTTDTM